MKLLTVSIAAYHVEDYLRETLDSFLIPEVTDQLEVLIVNDGSGEGVNEIAREYQTNYPDVFRLIDKENGGHGSTVNRGIEEAAGKYFKTVGTGCISDLPAGRGDWKGGRALQKPDQRKAYRRNLWLS